MRRSLVLPLALSLIPLATAAASAQSSDADLAARYRHGRAPHPFLDALSAGRLERHPPPPKQQKGYRAAAVPVGWALTGAELAPFDVTDTDPGRQEVAAFVGRLRSRGIEAGDVSYAVYSLPGVKGLPQPGSAGDPRANGEDGPLANALVVPRDTAVELVGDLYDDNGLQVETLLSAAPRQPEVHVLAAPSESRRWTEAGGLTCTYRKSNNTAWYDPCQFFWWLSGDNDPDHQSLASQMYGTGKSKGIWRLNTLEVQSYPEPGGAQQRWVDWDPKADTKSDCEKTTVTVTVEGLGLSRDAQRCERWDIDKKVEPGDFANRWRGGAVRSERSTAAVTATQVDNGATPRYLFEFDYYAKPE